MTDTKDKNSSKKAKKEKAPPITIDEWQGTKQEQLKKLEEQRLKIEKEINDLRRIETSLSNRSLDAKKKILLGSFLQQWAGNENRKPITSYNDLVRMLDEYVKDKDRDFFNFDLQPNKAKQEPNSALQGVKNTLEPNKSNLASQGQGIKSPQEIDITLS